MLRLFGSYDVVVAGAGATGVVAAISAGRAGARVLMIEGTGFIGGNVTAGRLTKPTGTVEAGIFWEMMQRSARFGGADLEDRTTSWGSYTGIFDPETIQRVMIEMLDDAKVEILLHANIIDVLNEDDRVRGLEIMVKSGRQIVLAGSLVDASGDGDVAAFAGAAFEMGRPDDALTQPMTTYVRMIGVDVPELARYVAATPEDFTAIVLPEQLTNDPADYTFRVMVSGFRSLVAKARAANEWDLPKNYMTLKTGMIPGEINLNVTRFQGNGLDARELSRAEIELRKQAYEAVDFVRKYLPGCQDSALLDIAPKLGVRETRRITGQYTLTWQDLQDARNFPDTIGLARAPVDIHEPGGEGGLVAAVSQHYGIPYRCLLPKNVEGVLLAGRCISVDEIAFGSTRNIPVCAITGEAAGVAAALAAKNGVSPGQLDVGEVQRALSQRGLALGLPAPASV